MPISAPATRALSQQRQAEPDTLPSFQDNVLFLQGGSPGGTAGSTGAAAGTSPPPSPAPQAAPETPTQAQRLPGQVRYDPSQGSLGAGFLQPLRQSVGEAGQAIGLAGETFRTGAGPMRDFQTAGGQRILESALPASALPGEITQAKDLLSANYQGPMGLSPELLGKTAETAQDIETQASALQTGGGLQTLLRQGIPGLNPGMARVEAQRLFDTPDFRRQAAQVGQQASALAPQLTQEVLGAQKYAEDRVATEESLRQAAKGYLEEKRTGILAPLEAQAQEANAKQLALQQLYDKFLETGNLEDLIAAAPDASVLKDSRYTQAPEAEAIWEKIMGDPRYAKVADIPLMQKTISPRGKETYTVPGGKWGGAEVYGQLKSGKLTPKQWKLILERQKRLEKYFGPDTKYDWYRPLYLGGKAGATQFQTPALESFTALDEGTFSTRETFATEADRQTFGRINELLEETDRLVAAGEPYRAASVAVETDRFIGELEKQAKKLERAQTKGWQDFKAQVRKARKKFKQSRGGFLGEMSNRLLGSRALGVWGTGLATAGLKGDVGGLLKGGFEAPSVGMKVSREAPERALDLAGRAPERGVDQAGRTLGQAENTMAEIEAEARAQREQALARLESSQEPQRDTLGAGLEGLGAPAPGLDSLPLDLLERLRRRRQFV